MTPRTKRYRHLSLAGLFITGLIAVLAGCGNKATGGPKTAVQTNAFKGSAPPPDVQKKIDATMAGLAKEGKHGPLKTSVPQ